MKIKVTIELTDRQVEAVKSYLAELQGVEPEDIKLWEVRNEIKYHCNQYMESNEAIIQHQKYVDERGN